MKHQNIRKRLQRMFLTLWATLLGFWSFAQDGGGGASIKISTGESSGGGGNWYANPWIWVIGGAVFVLLLVALLRGGRRSD